MFDWLPGGSEHFDLDIFFEVAAAKDFSEMVPHNAQSFLMLGIALERYILVCHAALAKQHYKGYVRYGLYLAITLLILLTSVLPLAEVLYFLINFQGPVNGVGYWVTSETHYLTLFRFFSFFLVFHSFV